MTRIARIPLALAALSIAALGLSGCSAPASVVGTWGDVSAENTPSLVFEEKGTFHGTDGCNRLGGEWKANGEEIDLGEIFSTLMFCEGVDTWLSNAATAKVSSRTLTILDREGAEIGTLERAQ